MWNLNKDLEWNLKKVRNYFLFKFGVLEEDIQFVEEYSQRLLFIGHVGYLDLNKNLDYKKDSNIFSDFNSSQTPCKDYSVISKCINLTEVSLKECELKDISFLKNLVNLEFLSLSLNQIQDFSPLGNLTGLWQLSIAHNKTFHKNGFPIELDLSFVENLPLLTSLNIRGNSFKLESLEVLKKLENLHILDLRGDPSLHHKIDKLELTARILF